jgi:hypothetical protein
MNTNIAPSRGGGMRFFTCIHHLALLAEYLGCNKGISVILKNGDEVDLIHQPRVGEYTWETANGPVLSDDIEAIIDGSEHGYH